MKMQWVNESDSGNAYVAVSASGIQRFTDQLKESKGID